jgi:hypothetical protein
MEDELSVPLETRQWDHIVESFAKLARHAPQAYPQWAGWAASGLDGARDRDLGAVRTVCRGCHTAYREDYRRRMPSRPAPTSTHPR